MAIMTTAAAAFKRRFRFHTTSRCLLNGLRLSSSMSNKAKVVVCGGGVTGTSVAYHLAEQGGMDVLLVEQGRYVSALKLCMIPAGQLRLCLSTWCVACVHS